MLGDILNSGDNVDVKEDYGFRDSYFKIAPTILNYNTKNKCLNMQLENLRLQRNIQNIGKQSDERYQKNMIDDKEYDEKYQFFEKGRNIEYRYRSLET